MNTKTEVYCTLQVEGLHCWPQAKDVFPAVAYLSDMHRHIFHFKAWSPVNHDDRDVEFIMLKHSLQTYLKCKYFDDFHCIHKFGRRSCEDLANEILETFPDINRVEVNEDGENGCVKWRIDN